MFILYNIPFTHPNRVVESIITRLRFGHNHLNAYRYRIGAHTTPNCEVCLEEEDVSHFLFDCAKYIIPRLEAHEQFKKHKIPYTLLNHLGEDNQGTDITYKYIQATQRFIYVPNQ